MNLDPAQIAENLILENGVDKAFMIALDVTIDAHAKGDNYLLSVWREVKAILGEKKKALAS